jgi:beta-lactamase class A
MGNLSGVHARIHDLIKAGSGRVGLVIKDLATGEALQWSADERFPSASLIKIPILVEALRQAQFDPLMLEERVPIYPDIRAEGSGILKELPSVESASLLDLLTLMIIVSDNTATNLCIERLGMAAVNDTIATLGLKATVLQRRMMDMAARDRGLDNYTSAADMAHILELLAIKKILTPEGCAQALGILERQQLKDRLPLLLPPEVKVAHKTGGLPGVCHDAGILQWESHQIIVTALTQGFPEPEAGLVGQGAGILIARISRMVYEAAAKG